MIQLKPITRENLENVLALRVSTEQLRYVSPTAHSLAQAYVYRETAFPFAVYADETLVGFIMFGYYEARRQYTLWKFLIDQRYQGQGYGKAALMQGIAYMKETFSAKELYTGVSLGNAVAKQLYRSVGFSETGLVEDGMEEMKYTC